MKGVRSIQILGIDGQLYHNNANARLIEHVKSTIEEDKKYVEKKRFTRKHNKGLIYEYIYKSNHFAFERHFT